MTASSERTSEQLLKRAKYGGRNVTGLAILMTLAAVIGSLAALSFAGKDAVWIALPLVALATSYWCLAIAARRGNQLAINIVIGFLAVQFVFSVLAQVVALIRTNGAEPLNILGIAIPLMVIIALSRNRTDLLELRNRGLWEFVFGTESPPTSKLCKIGGALMFVGFVSLYAELLIPAIQATKVAKLRKNFVNLVKVDDVDFLKSLDELHGSNDPEAFKNLLTKIDNLKQKAESVARDASSDSVLGPIFSKY
ncbi:MAG TPA: hypothetical protein VGI75_06225, partial [Pirellulales bacterium]